ncbi:hypothetical protein [Streptomyces sp. TRM68367]|uniref:hypothetical protein n=1 Tax=Streptomyces sp. TRM68367 TaxID=2758415 RepID=UPI00165BC0F5|nr:hypothetical protein [Streptomyces sp. TRM68367]MBC9724452.1 hypothetical protein [Streptomyces sp. TRM68367]
MPSPELSASFRQCGAPVAAGLGEGGGGGELVGVGVLAVHGLDGEVAAGAERARWITSMPPDPRWSSVR